jgi:hypothetical protein
MAEVVISAGVAGLSVAASLITIKDGVNDIMGSRGGDRERIYERVRADIDDLGREIILMVEDNKKLRGYKELHKEVQTLLSYVDSLHGYIQNTHDDEGDPNKLKQHINDASINLGEKVGPQKSRIVQITEENNYSYLNEDPKVNFYVDAIRSELESLRFAVRQVTENPSQKLDRYAKTYCLNIIESSGSFMQYLDLMIKILSENLEKEITMFETRFNEYQQVEE